MALLISMEDGTAVCPMKMVKTHLRVYDSDQDELIQLYLNAAVRAAENYLGYQLRDVQFKRLIGTREYVTIPEFASGIKVYASEQEVIDDSRLSLQISESGAIISMVDGSSFGVNSSVVYTKKHEGLISDAIKSAILLKTTELFDERADVPRERKSAFEKLLDLEKERIGI